MPPPPPGTRPEPGEAEAFAARFPAWARLLALRHAQVARLEGQVMLLTDRLAHDRALGDRLHELLSAVTAIRSSASILAEGPDLDANWRARFQRNIVEDSARLARGAQALADHLEAEGEAAARTLAPRDEAEGFIARHRPRIAAGEMGGHADAFARAETALAGAEGQALTPAARAIAGTMLAGLVEDATRLPLAAMRRALDAHGVEPVRIARMLGADLACVLRRLAALPARMLPGPAGILSCDASGAILQRGAVPDFAVPRHGDLCALWPLFSALAQPMRPIRRVLSQGGGRAAVLTWTVASPMAEPGPGEDLRLVSHMLVLPAPAGEAAQALGVACRSCHVAGCPARREPSMLSQVGG